MLEWTIALVAFLAGIVQGAFGFGYAIAALTTIPFLLTPQSAHIVISLSGIPVMAMAAWTAREGGNWRPTLFAILGGAVCLPLGLFMFKQLSADQLIRGTGCAILILMLSELFKLYRKKSTLHRTDPSDRSAVLAGMIGGFLAGAVSIGGPPVVAYAMKRDWTPLQSKAFITRCLLCISVSKGFGLFAVNLVNSSHLFFASLAIPSAVLGVWIGAWMTRSVSTTHYKTAAILVLTVVSAWWIYQGAPANQTPDSSDEQSSASIS